MNRERFLQLCAEVGVEPEMAQHLWEFHPPPAWITDDQVRQYAPRMAGGQHNLVEGPDPEELLAWLFEQLDGKLPAA